MEYIIDKHIVSGCLYHVPDWTCSTGWSMVDHHLVYNTFSIFDGIRKILVAKKNKKNKKTQLRIN